MISPKAPEELTQAIEALFSAYMEEGRRAVYLALERLMAKGRTPPKTRRRASNSEKKPCSQRSTEELGELKEKLYEVVCAHAGTSMPIFANALGVTSRELQRPVLRLRDQGVFASSMHTIRLTTFRPFLGDRKHSPVQVG